MSNDRRIGIWDAFSESLRTVHATTAGGVVEVAAYVKMNLFYRLFPCGLSAAFKEYSNVGD